MGGCFSGQKGLEAENAPVQPPISPKAAEAEPVAAAAPVTENVETQKEEPLVNVSETKEEDVKKDAEVAPKKALVVAEAEPVVEAPAAATEEKVAEEKAAEVVSDVKEESKVAEVTSGSGDKTGAAPAPAAL